MEEFSDYLSLRHAIVYTEHELRSIHVSRFIDLSGQRFGAWTVQKRASGQFCRTTFECVCDCGSVRNVQGSNLTNRTSRSCGCQKVTGTFSCEVCGKDKKRNTNAISRFCSRACMLASLRTGPYQEQKACVHCGARFVATNGNIKHCSTLCRIYDRSNLNETTGCLEWSGSTNKLGYGTIGINGKIQLVHRAMYRELTGYEGGLLVMHTCDNPRCCEITHLRIGTHDDNMADMKAKGRSASPQGERSKNAKLNTEKVKYIRNALSGGFVSQQALADEMGVSQVLVSLVGRRKIWKQVA